MFQLGDVQSQFVVDDLKLVLTDEDREALLAAKDGGSKIGGSKIDGSKISESKIGGS
jgi:hypothetical protein